MKRLTDAQVRVLRVLALYDEDRPGGIMTSSATSDDPRNPYIASGSAMALAERGLVERADYEGPARSSWPRYRITDAGRAALAEVG